MKRTGVALSVLLVVLASASADTPASQPSVPDLIKVRYFAGNGQEFTVTDHASCQAVMEWLKKAESGPLLTCTSPPQTTPAS